MKRFATYDPPEYHNWTADPAEVQRYRERIAADPEREAVIRALSQDQLLDLYAGLLRNRLHDVALKRWVKNGVISKAWLGVGEEAATIGPVHALRRSGPDHDVVAPMIRNSGACHEMGMPVTDILRTYLGTADSPSGGRDLHVGELSTGVLPPISHVGDVVPVIAGIALSFKQRGQDRVGMTWIGDGSTKTAAFHEGVNFAGVHRLPVIFIIQNNQVALGTRLSQHAAGSFADWPAMYGLGGGVFDGNHVLDAYAAARLAADRARAGEGASLLIAETFRMGGHATHDEREARAIFDTELFASWGRRDPVGLYEAWLVEQGIGAGVLEEIEARVSKEIDEAAEEALRSRERAMPVPETAALGVYA
ncbi:MAG TPA: thiamine pyrophosphate-dependent enzyme [Longimicrobium sp.]|jgi:pyruvate dehydrogenase E1 component alpha subunit/2-oxoisovalerate dehydrogenase E1 component alpha subunit|uniref:thiamine pyrophosphate-dependent dehydrogenase E1 component subunit alpha n=1 Tax=Longimicrobium sp. TaxID=2029185 RepID=UPI002ED90188